MYSAALKPYKSFDRDIDILDALSSDQTFKFRETDKTYNKGLCPDCNRKSVWVSKEKPGRVYCDHQTTCGYSETTKSLYPDLFENYSKRFPATHEDPKATARNYLMDRGFEPHIVADWYEQGYHQIKDGPLVATVRIPLWDGFYWERIIDKKHVDLAGRKNSYSYGFEYRGKHWQPKDFCLESGDACYITEGIFDAWVFKHLEFKSIAALSSSNFPSELVEANRGRSIKWILAYDNDVAGIKSCLKFAAILDELGEAYQVLLTRNSSNDWNDEYQLNQLDRKYLNDGLWRGRVSMSPNPREKAFWLWVKAASSCVKMDFGNALYSYNIDQKINKEWGQVLASHGSDVQDLWVKNNTEFILDAQLIFYSSISGGRVSNCLPRFLYIERDPLTDEQDYFFNVRFMNRNKERLIALDGSALESVSSLNKALLNKTSGGTFDGDSGDMKKLKSEWFDHKTTEVTRLRFIGYDKDSRAWVYPEFGFHQGRLIKQNNMGYLDAGDIKLKTKVSKNQVKMIHSTSHDESWIGIFHQTFGKNGLIVMSWWLCTLYAEHIRHSYQDWPFLELTGEPGTGKTSLIKFLWRCVGRTDGYEGFDPSKSTLVGRSRTLERYSALPTILIEADRSDKGEKFGSRKMFDFNEFKDFFNGGIIRTTGIRNGGNETVEPNYRGGVLIAQNASVDSDDDAVMERIVHCHSTKSHHTAESKQLADQINDMETKSLCGWMYRALTGEKQFLSLFAQSLKSIRSNYRQRPESVRDRIIDNHAKIAAGVYCLKILFPTYMSNELCDDLCDELWSMAVTREQRIKADAPLVEQFWEYYAELNVIEAGYNGRRSATAERLNHSANPDLIAINMVEFEQMASSNGLRISIGDLKKQLPHSHSRPFLGRKNVRSKIINGTKSCWVFCSGEPTH